MPAPRLSTSTLNGPPSACPRAVRRTARQRLFRKTGAGGSTTIDRAASVKVFAMSHERGCETLLVFLARRRTVPKHLEPDRYLAVSAAPGPPAVGHRRHHPGLEIAAGRGGSTRRTGV